MKKAAACMTAGLLALALTAGNNTEAAMYKDYLAKNTDWKSYYNEVYRPVYAAYREAVENLRTEIRGLTFEGRAHAEKVLAFLKNLTAAHRAFYGGRTTAGLSRYEVSAAREAMYKAADKDKDYDAAIRYCARLKALMEERVAFLRDASAKIAAYRPAFPPNGIAWLEQQLSTPGSAVYDYFSGKGARTSLDSTGLHFAPPVNASMKAATGIGADTDASWRIYPCDNGTYNILWSYTCLAYLKAGDTLPAVVFYNTGTRQERSGSAVAVAKAVDNGSFLIMQDFKANP